MDTDNNVGSYQPKRQSTRLTVSQVEPGYAVQRWGQPDQPAVWLLHGWMDVGATFQFLIDALPPALFEAHVWYAPDWRGFGDSGWAGRSYWFPDYLADLDGLLSALTPDAPVSLVGHSMGGIVAMLYAGIRRERVARIASLEGFGLQATQATQSPPRVARWLDGLADPPTLKAYPALDALVAYLRRQHPRLTQDKALFLAGELARQDEDGWRLKADPRHKLVNPILYRLEEHLETWRRITAPVLWLQGGDGWVADFLKEDAAAFRRRTEVISQLTEVELPDCGHQMLWERPDAVAEALLQWWSA